MANIMLTATSYGLSTCPIGYLDVDKASQILNLPEHLACLFLLPVGYADEVPDDKELLSIEEITFYDRWKCSQYLTYNSICLTYD
jgi:nitroreductase